jgi:metallo-beta-lactamase class B
MGTKSGGPSTAVSCKSLKFCRYLPLLLLLCAAIGQDKTSACAQCIEWNQPQAPFRIFGNSYYVGTHGLSSILVISDAGHILIDGDLPDSAKQIVSNIRSLGFHIEDVKIILNSHVHFDHAGGIAELQRLSGARVIASKWSAAVMKKGGFGVGDPQYGVLTPIQPIANIHELQDGEIIRLGDVALTAHLTPGHTPGGTSWTWKSCEGDLCRNIVYADSVTPVAAEGFRFTTRREYPEALGDFEKSFAFLETTPCDLLITPHPELSDLWDRLEARQRGVKPDPMVNTSACRELAEHSREQLRRRIAEERASKSGSSE